MTAVLEHVSEQAWSTWTKADYTPEQWHNACILHLHTGPVDNKEQCKLPVKTPAGALNRNGVHAAAAALAGARGGVNAPPDKIAAARARIRGLYRQLGEGQQVPDSMKQSAFVEQVLAHYGVLGMKWGVRNARTRQNYARRGKGSSSSEDARRAAALQQRARSGGTRSLSNAEMQQLINRMNLDRQYSSLNPSMYKRGMTRTNQILAVAGAVTTATAFAASPAGQAMIRGLRSAAGKTALNIALRTTRLKR